MPQLQIWLNDLEVFERFFLALRQLFEVPELLKGEAVSSHKNDSRVVVIRCLSDLLQKINESISEVRGRRLILC